MTLTNFSSNLFGAAGNNISHRNKAEISECQDQPTRACLLSSKHTCSEYNVPPISLYPYFRAPFNHAFLYLSAINGYNNVPKAEYSSSKSEYPVVSPVKREPESESEEELYQKSKKPKISEEIEKNKNNHAKDYGPTIEAVEENRAYEHNQFIETILSLASENEKLASIGKRSSCFLSIEDIILRLCYIRLGLLKMSELQKERPSVSSSCDGSNVASSLDRPMQGSLSHPGPSQFNAVSERPSVSSSCDGSNVASSLDRPMQGSLSHPGPSQFNAASERPSGSVSNPGPSQRIAISETPSISSFLRAPSNPGRSQLFAISERPSRSVSNPGPSLFVDITEIPAPSSLRGRSNVASSQNKPMQGPVPSPGPSIIAASERPSDSSWYTRSNFSSTPDQPVRESVSNPGPSSSTGPSAKSQTLLERILNPTLMEEYSAKLEMILAEARNFNNNVRPTRPQIDVKSPTKDAKRLHYKMQACPKGWISLIDCNKQHWLFGPSGMQLEKEVYDSLPWGDYYKVTHALIQHFYDKNEPWDPDWIFGIIDLVMKAFNLTSGTVMHAIEAWQRKNLRRRRYRR